MRQLRKLGSLAIASVALLATFTIASSVSADNTTVTIAGNDGGCSFTDLQFLGEFNPGVPVVVTAVAVEVDAYDVDQADGEVDNVSLNGELLGSLTGSGGSNSTTTFNLTPAQIAAIFGGTPSQVDLTVDIDVDVNSGGWCVGIYETRIDIEYDVVPTLESADQCKKGGWMGPLVDGAGNLLVFTNQGDCVSYVETAGSNEPGQNIPTSKE